METSGFFNSELVNGVEDRAYIPEQFSEYFANFVSNGYFANPTDALQVVNPTGLGMTLQIKAGTAFINGFWYKNSTTLPKTLEAADGLLPRIDAIVVRKTVSTRETKVFIKKGTPASSPVAPTVTRDGNVYELMLATVYIAPGTLNITNANITDTRMNESVCGVVKGLIEEIQTNDLFAQFTDAFNIWFNAIKDQLTTDAAASLQLQINNINTNAGGWKTYANLAAISDTLTSASTLKDIIPLMANRTRIILTPPTDSSVSDMLNSSSINILEIVRHSGSRVYITGFRAHANVAESNAAEYFAVWESTTLTCKGFYKLMDSNDPGYVYSSITELGLNPATCTLQDIVNTMMVGSEYRVAAVATAYPKITFPTALGKICLRKWSNLSSEVEWYPADTSNKAYYFMATNVHTGILTGTWTQYATKTDLGVQVAVQSTAPADTTKLWVY